MKTKTINLYQFDELSDAAKQNAIDRWREGNNDFIPWEQENRDTLDAFEKVFPIKVKDWEYGYRNYINFEMHTDYDEIQDLTSWRLVSYLWNNYRRDLFKGKYYTVKINNREVKHKRVKAQTFKNGNVHNAYYSVITLDNCCVLTGYCMDDIILKEIYDYMNKPDGRNFKELIYDCLQNWIEACNKEVEYNNSDEGIIETIRANDYDFTADGRLN